MIDLKIVDKSVRLHFGPLMAEWLWLDTIQGEVTAARADWVPLALFYAHKNWCRIDGNPLKVTKAEVYQWFEQADESEYTEALAGYEESKAKERWEKLTESLAQVVDDAQKKMSIETLEGTVTES